MFFDNLLILSIQIIRERLIVLLATQRGLMSRPSNRTLSAQSDGENNTKKLKETYGPDADPHVLPFDPLVAIAAAGGRPNGRMVVHLDSVITSSLPRVNTLRAMSTSSTPTVERHVPHSVSIIEDIQVSASSLILHGPSSLILLHY